MNSGTGQIITVFEHENLTLNRPGFEQRHLEALQRYHGAKGTPFFSLIHKGVKFNQYAGVIRVGQLMIEVLPKTDRPARDDSENVTEWRHVLIKMLRIAMDIEAHDTSSGDLKLMKNSVLDLYFYLFITECERIVRSGLVKKYRRVSANITALKGRLSMTDHIRRNTVHKERFFVEYTQYDRNHLMNCLLHETLFLLSENLSRPLYSSRIKNLLLEFENCSRIVPREEHFRRLNFDRKSECYRQAIQIARLILMNYHPDISKGHDHVLALMFDMNGLWEHYVGRMLRRHLSSDYRVVRQKSRVFWRSERACKRLRPDIILDPMADGGERIVIDTKWKLPTGFLPSDQDLRQIFAYNRMFGSGAGVLLYPGVAGSLNGFFQTEGGGSCSLVALDIMDSQGKLISDDSFLRPLEEIICGLGCLEERRTIQTVA